MDGWDAWDEQGEVGGLLKHDIVLRRQILLLPKNPSGTS